MPDIKEIVGGVFTLIVGIYLIKEITAALSIGYGSLFVGLLIVLGIIWFIREVFGL